jgi:IS5 family transposase
MRQQRTIQSTIFEVFAEHEIGCALKAISEWLDRQRPLVSLVASDLRRQGARETGRRGLPAETVLRCWPFVAIKLAELAGNAHSRQC